MTLLNKNFVCTWKNIQGKTSYAGSSNIHLPQYAAQEVETCAGHHNVQMFFMTSDGKIVNCLPGYWSPKSFLEEANLALTLNKNYVQIRSVAKRNDQFLDLHLNQALVYDQHTQERSRLTGFDQAFLENKKETDFKSKQGFLPGSFKSTIQVVHERMAERPYLDFEAFDVPSFIEMGTKQYSYHFGIPKNHEKLLQKANKK